MTIWTSRISASRFFQIVKNKCITISLTDQLIILKRSSSLSHLGFKK